MSGAEVSLFRLFREEVAAHTATLMPAWWSWRLTPPTRSASSR